MRKKIVAGNWKMNNTIADAVALATGVKDGVNDSAVDVVLCTPFTCLKSVGDVVAGSNVSVGAQNMCDKASGAYTGETSADMIKDTGASYVILGHSERRQYYGETDATVNAKTLFALENGLNPIVCVGEQLEDREAEKTEEVVGTQLRGCLAGLSDDQIESLVIAYEPVWAIGTGLTASPEQAQEVHAFIRDLLTELSNDAVSQNVRIQYGGSMKPANAAELLSQPDIDGGLIGGASLDSTSFLDIIKAAG